MGVYDVHIVGLRDLLGRFASMRNEGLVAIQLEEAEALASVIEDVYRRHAPRSQKGHAHFADTLHAEAEATDAGFSLELTTDDPELREWLAEGTGIYAGHGRITSHSGGPMGPIFDWAPGGSGPLWFYSIRGMPANPWEATARDEVEPLVEDMGGRIGVRVVAGLSGGA